LICVQALVGGAPQEELVEQVEVPVPDIVHELLEGHSLGHVGYLAKGSISIRGLYLLPREIELFDDLVAGFEVDAGIAVGGLYAESQVGYATEKDQAELVPGFQND
jgi:hypothetical protein